VLLSNDDSCIGLGNGTDVLIGNEYKGAEDCLGLSKKRKNNKARSQRRILKRNQEKICFGQLWHIF